jgi:hypothetical protein
MSSDRKPVGAETREPTFVATVGYVRSLGIGSLDAYCKGKRAGAWPCHDSGIVSLADISDEATIRSVERRLVCTQCGAIEPHTRPNWRELSAPQIVDFKRAHPRA